VFMCGGWQTDPSRQGPQRAEYTHPRGNNMNGLSIEDLRSAGASLRHQSGINTCARCLSHYFQQDKPLPAVGMTGAEAIVAAAAAGATPPANLEECFIHTRDLVSSSPSSDDLAYPCCGAAQGTRGCVPAAHLPMFQTVSGAIQPGRRIDYGNVDLHAGRWVSTRMSLQQLSKKEGQTEAAAAAAVSATAAVSSEKKDATPVLPVSTLPLAVPDAPAALGEPVPRVGDEIMVCGRLYHTGTPVVLWGDVGGYDHYRTERRFCPIDQADWATTQKEVPGMNTPNRFGLRMDGLTPQQVEAVRGGQWDLPTLQQQMKQLVMHYDEAGLSRECFRILQDFRDLSIHFMCDIDGTLYQALDLKERAWQATTSNTCSVGIEIANVGAYNPNGPNPFGQWYGKNAQGQTILTIPAKYGDGGVRTPNFVGQPSRPTPVAGNVQGTNLIQMDYTPQQYAALSKLVAAFCTVFPQIPASYPVDSQGHLITSKLPDATLASYRGLLGHYHIQTNKIDPGPAFQWPLLIKQAKSIMEQAKKAKADVEAQTAAAAAAVAGSTSVSAPSISAAERASEQSLLRKLERKIFASAEAEAAASLAPGHKFYLVEAKWWDSWKAWMSSSSSDASATRPGPVTNLVLLESDERTPRAGLVYQTSYRATHAKIWAEMVELYGAEATIVRDSTDIYNGAAGGSKAPAASAAAAPAAKVEQPAAEAPAAAPSAEPGTFVVPVIEAETEEPWILVTKRVMA